MKKTFAIFLLLLSFGLVSCAGSEKNKTDNSSTPNVVTEKNENSKKQVRAPKKGEYLYQALGDEKLENIKSEPPVELTFYVDQSGRAQEAVFKKGDALNRALELFCEIKIGKKSNEFVTDNYNWIEVTWEDGSQSNISLNLSRLEYYSGSKSYIYELDHLDDFWSYCEGYMGLVSAECPELGFTTMAYPAYKCRTDEEDGFYIFIEDAGYVPYVLIWWYPLLSPDDDISAFISEEFTPAMQEAFGEVSYEEYEDYEIGGKNLPAGLYTYENSQGITLDALMLFDIVDDRVLAYQARFKHGHGEDTLAALDTAIKNFMVDDTGV